MKNLKTTHLLRSLFLGMITLVMISPKDAVAENYSSVSFQVFYDELTPYGDWVKDARYGYIWLPAVQQGFHPYGSDGHWVMTGYGNTWVSDYDWGWATFHYGRWYFDNNYRSWAWIPDYEWGPAWVDWRSGGGYYGWAPMGPGFTVNFRVNIPSNYWVFVPQRRFAYRNVYNYYVPYAKRVNIYNNTTIINNTVIYNNNSYYAGPAKREIERVTNNSYPVREVRTVSSPGRVAVSKNSVNVYQPSLRNTSKSTEIGRPARVLSTTEARASRSNTSATTAKTSTGNSVRSSRGTVNSSRGTGNDKAASESSIDYKPYNGRTSPSNNQRSSTNTSTSRSTMPNSNSRSATSTQSRAASNQNSTSNQSRTSAPTPRTKDVNTQRNTVSPTRSSRSDVNTRSAQSNGQNVRPTTPQASPRSSAPKVSSSNKSNTRTTPAATSSRTSSSSSRSSRSGNN